MRTIFLLVPSPHSTGPVKGAYALANAIAPYRRTVIVHLKSGPGVDASLDDRVETVTLAAVRNNWWDKLRAYRRLLLEAGGRDRVGSISMCLSADLINFFSNKYALTCCSVRGNLPQNYRHDYGIFGLPMAFGHLQLLRGFDRVVAMTQAMADQIRHYTNIQSSVIGNFVDEPALDRYRQSPSTTSSPIRYVFVGSLSQRKRPDVLLDALYKLGTNCQLDVIGDGPLKTKMQSILDEKQLQGRVRLHGHQADPYSIIARADVFVLPSYSEGVSRAALEALHLGLPCVLRNVDGNEELLGPKSLGVLFNCDDDLAAAMNEASARARKRVTKSSLLPPHFRQLACAQEYLQLLE